MESASFLVTGGCGHQGTQVVLKLVEKYPAAKITAASRNPTVNIIPGVQYIKLNLASADDIHRVLEQVKPTVVFHCAASMTIGREATSDELVRAVNIDGTRFLLEECRRQGVKAFVFTSSGSVIRKNETMTMKDCDESLPTVTEDDNVDLYCKTKAEGERLVLAADDSDGMRTCSLRVSTLYGEYDNDHIPGMLKSVRAGKQRNQVGDGNNVFSVTYSGNSAVAHLLAAQKLLTSPAGVGGEAFFINNGTSIKFWDHCRAVFKAAGSEVKPEEIVKVPVFVAIIFAVISEWVAWVKGTRPAMARTTVNLITKDYTFKIDKARERLGYEPVVGYEEGVARSVKWALDKEAAEAAK